MSGRSCATTPATRKLTGRRRRVRARDQVRVSSAIAFFAQMSSTRALPSAAAAINAGHMGRAPEGVEDLARLDADQLRPPRGRRRSRRSTRHRARSPRRDARSTLARCFTSAQGCVPGFRFTVRCRGLPESLGRGWHRGVARVAPETSLEIDEAPFEEVMRAGGATTSSSRSVALAQLLIGRFAVALPILRHATNSSNIVVISRTRRSQLD